MQDRKRLIPNRSDPVENGRIRDEHPELTITMGELRDICYLIKNHEWPDGTFGDIDCTAWSIIRTELGIYY